MRLFVAFVCAILLCVPVWSRENVVKVGGRRNRVPSEAVQNLEQIEASMKMLDEKVVLLQQQLKMLNDVASQAQPGEKKPGQAGAGDANVKAKLMEELKMAQTEADAARAELELLKREAEHRKGPVITGDTKKETPDAQKRAPKVQMDEIKPQNGMNVDQKGAKTPTTTPKVGDKAPVDAAKNATGTPTPAGATVVPKKCAEGDTKCMEEQKLAAAQTAGEPVAKTGEKKTKTGTGSNTGSSSKSGSDTETTRERERRERRERHRRRERRERERKRRERRRKSDSESTNKNRRRRNRSEL